MMERFTTQAVKPHERGRHWQGLICDYYPAVQIDIEDAEIFSGQIRTKKLGDMRITRVNSRGQHVSRTRKEVLSAREDVLQLNFQIVGEGFVTQDGRECVTTPGTFAIYDSTRPYELRFKGAFEQICFNLPRAFVRQRYGTFDTFTARAISGYSGPGRFLFAFMQQVLAEDESEQNPFHDRLQEHFSDLLVTAVSQFSAQVVRAGPAGRVATLTRVKNIALGQLRNPEVAPESVARTAGISIRSLHALFDQDETTFCRWLQQARLMRCKSDIENPNLRTRSIGDIAYSWGFSDAAHFSRSFRQAFGLTPRECRAGGRRSQVQEAIANEAQETSRAYS